MIAALRSRAGAAHPVEAFLWTLGAFALCSLLLNLVVRVAYHHGLQDALGGLLFLTIPIAIGFLALFSVPISAAANTSRRYRKVVLLAAAVAALLIYVVALRFELRILTQWVFPYLPGLDFAYASFDIGAVAVGLAIIFGAALAGLVETPEGPAIPADPLDAARAAGEKAGEESQDEGGAEDVELEIELG